MNTGKLLRNKGKTRAYQIKTWNLSPGGTNIDSPGTAYLLTSHRNSTSDGFDSFGSWNCSDVLDFFGVGGLSLNSHEAEEAFLFVPGLLDFLTRGLSLNSFEAEEAFLVVPCSLGSVVEVSSRSFLFWALATMMFSPYLFLATIDKCFSWVARALELGRKIISREVE